MLWTRWIIKKSEKSISQRSINSGRLYYANVSTKESQWNPPPPAPPSVPVKVENTLYTISAAAVSGVIPSSNNISTNNIISTSAKGVTYPEVTFTYHQNQSTLVSKINHNSSATISNTNTNPSPNVISMLLVENQRRRLLEQKQQKPISSGDVTILDVPLEVEILPSLSTGM